MAKLPLGLRLADHAKQFMPVPAGGKVFQAGQPGDCMYAVKTGTLQVRIGKTVVETLGPGDVFGEMALLNENEVRSATVVAVSDSVLAVIDAKRFEFMVKHVPSFAIELMRVLAARLLEMNKRVRAPA
jgi:CRP-like cAMP-binding protein